MSLSTSETRQLDEAYPFADESLPKARWVMMFRRTRRREQGKCMGAQEVSISKEIYLGIQPASTRIFARLQQQAEKSKEVSGITSQ